MNSGNDNLPPSKGNKPKPTPTADARRKSRRAKQSGQKAIKSEPVLPEIKQQSTPIPPVAPIPPIPISSTEQTNPPEPPKPRSKQPYPFKLVIALLSLLILGLVGVGVFLIVSPDGRSIKLDTEPIPARLDLNKQSSLPASASPAAKPTGEAQKSKGRKT